MKKNDIYRDFKVLETVEVADYQSVGVWLRHQKTGLEVFHLLNSDAENLFAFAFRTPSRDSTGVAHVLEHSVLCGSERYPLKDPFLQLTNQSVNTFLNAYTASEHTVFPASSLVKADYFNLFSVYADAVFFPLLKPEVFMQECHRVELDAHGKATIQGVVYNEMKGNYSSFENVASDEIDRIALQGSNYAYDSGGDPKDIPSLTVEALRAFHKEYYCAANCLVFLYGNIPTEEQLDFLTEHVISRISDGGKAAVLPEPDFSQPMPKTVRCFGPADEDTGDGSNVAALVWRLSDDIQKEKGDEFLLQMSFIDELLWGEDSSPVARDLLASGIGEDIAPQTGASLHVRFPSSCFAMHGVKKADEAAFKKAVFASLQKLCDEGIPAEELERVSMAYDFNIREVKRPNGNPFSLTLLRRVLQSWVFGAEPWTLISHRQLFENFKEKLAREPHCIEDLIRRYYLDNKRVSLVTVSPSASWSKKRLVAEEKLAKEQLAALGKEKVLALLQAMHEFQSKEEAESIIPHLGLSDLSREPLDSIKTGKSHVAGIPVYVNEEATNGIVYADVLFPADVLSPADYPYLPFLANICTDVGWNGIPWSEAMSKAGAVTGGFGASVAAFPALENKNPYEGRIWFSFHFDVLAEKVSEAFDLLKDCISGTDFKDLSRLKDVAASYYNSLKSSAVSHAHVYAMNRAAYKTGRAQAVKELWEGVASLFAARQIYDMDVAKLSALVRKLFKKLCAGGALVHLTGTKPAIRNAKKCLPSFIASLGLTAPLPAAAAEDRDFYSLCEKLVKPGIAAKANLKQPAVDEVCIIPGTVGYAVKAFPSAAYDTKESAQDLVYAHCLSTTELWKKVRTEGGAYGVFLNPKSPAKSTFFVTYRDPKPYESLEVLEQVISQSVCKDFSMEETEKAVIGSYSDELQPLSPHSKGSVGLSWELNGRTNAQRALRIRRMLRVKPADMHKTAVRYAENLQKEGMVVILCAKEQISPKLKENAGKILNLPI